MGKKLGELLIVDEGFIVKIYPHDIGDDWDHDLDPLPNLPLPYIDNFGDMFGIDEDGVFALLEENVKEDQISSEKYKLYRDNYKYWI